MRGDQRAVGQRDTVLVLSCALNFGECGMVLPVTSRQVLMPATGKLAAHSRYYRRSGA
jgi:hypothetical protein